MSSARGRRVQGYIESTGCRVMYSQALLLAAWLAGWADVSSALQQRRAELAAKQAAERKAAEEALQLEREAASEGADQTAAAGVAQPAHPPQAAQRAAAHGSMDGLSGEHPVAGDSVKPVGVATRSAVRPRGGARQGALGPFLARLRAAQD